MNVIFSKVVITICIVLNMLFWIGFGWYVDNKYGDKEEEKKKKDLKTDNIVCDIMLLINLTNLIIFLANF